MATPASPTAQLAVWGKRHQYIQGLDPLGMQPTSVATYALLLPGITNLTNRIRYYGFYCWLLSEYADRELHTIELLQQNFIRRAEFIVACMMEDQAHGIPQIPGTDHAGRQRGEATIDLAAHGDSGPNTYWQSSWGAFGQYYYGPMNAMGLIGRDVDKLSRCTDGTDATKVHGRRLAEAFRANLDPEAVAVFFDALLNGALDRTCLELLFNSFAIHSIPRDTDEWRLYVQMLQQLDHPTAQASTRTHRAHTLSLLLDAARGDVLSDPRAVLWDLYDKDWPTVQAAGDTEALWHVYLLNDLWQYAALAMFNGFHTALQDETHPREVEKVVSEYARAVVEQGLAGVKLPTEYRIGQLLPLDVPTEKQLTEDIHRGFRKGPWPDTMARGLALLLRLGERSMDHKLDMHTFAHAKGVLRSGHVFDGLEMIYRMDGKPVDEFLVHFIMRWLVLRHPFEAIRKAGQGARITLKFVVDDERIRALRYREPFPPQFTSPRLGPFINMLVDLGILEHTGHGFGLGGQAHLIQA